MNEDPEIIENPGEIRNSTAEKFGELIKETLHHDPHFYLFSPDETTSNKLDAAYKATARAWAMPKQNWDLPESEAGRIVELLSENTLFAMQVGHVLNGEQAIMTSYESFFTIITSQILQHLKFLKQSEETSWRPEYPAINLLSTSTCWRQDHNGFSHQSPALISTLLDNPNNRVNCLFPVDDISATACYNFMLESKNVVNLTTFNKTEEPRWIDKNHAKFQYEHGASIFGFISEDNPDYIFTAAGDIATKEAISAIKILKQDLPEKRFRFVGINALTHNAIGTTKSKMSQEIFNDYFGYDQPLIANFHGYPDTLKNILANYTYKERIAAHGFIEQGSTTTPFEMLSLNQASRYHLAIDVAKREGREDLVAKYSNILHENRRHAEEFSEDLENMI